MYVFERTVYKDTVAPGHCFAGDTYRLSAVNADPLSDSSVAVFAVLREV